MIPIRDTSEVFSAIQKAKAGASEFCTHFFPVKRKLQDWIDHAELLAELRDGAALFLRKDRDFWHFYFSAANEEMLHRAIGALPVLQTERLVVDLVGSKAVLDGLIALLESAGFRRYKFLYRMSRLAPTVPTPGSPGNPCVGYAEKTDVEAILDLLTKSFDRYAEQLPMPYEIQAAVEGRQFLVARRDGALGGLLFFETQGFTSTVRYWLVAEPFRMERLGGALIHRYFAVHSGVRRFVLWVIADNENAIARYRHYRYAPDGLVDHVLVNGMIRP